MGGYWINEGLPQYVVMYRNTENGCEIQKYSDGSAGIMIQLNLVKTEEEEEKNTEQDDTGIPHGANVLLETTNPWFKKCDRMVCADSYFASDGVQLKMSTFLRALSFK